MNNNFSKYFPHGKKQIAWLIDPDKVDVANFPSSVKNAEQTGVDLFFVGGSIIASHIEPVVEAIKKESSLPVVLFPGSNIQLSPNADAVLFLSLISGRNPEYLIGQHIQAAPFLAQTDVDVIPTGYVLIESGVQTSVEYVSNTRPIPRNKTDLIVATALAGKYLGLQALYLEAGSGAKQHVPTEAVKAVKEKTELPLIVGGGIRTAETASEIFGAGADVIVVGTAAERDPKILQGICKIKNR